MTSRARRFWPFVILWAAILIGSLSWPPGAHATASGCNSPACVAASIFPAQRDPGPGAVLPPAMRWIGKQELVPLTTVRNGHVYYAERNTYGFVRDDGRLAMVYAGANTDGASIPRFLWPIMPPDGPYLRAAGVHDACYKSHGTMAFHARPGVTPPFTRAECDETLREGMVALGVGWWPRVPIFLAVRWFGGAGWGL